MTEIERKLRQQLKWQEEEFTKQLNWISQKFKEDLNRIAADFAQQLDEATNVIEKQDRSLREYANALKNLESVLANGKMNITISSPPELKSLEEKLTQLEEDLNSLKSEFSQKLKSMENRLKVYFS